MNGTFPKTYHTEHPSHYLWIARELFGLASTIPSFISGKERSDLSLRAWSLIPRTRSRRRPTARCGWPTTIPTFGPSACLLVRKRQQRPNAKWIHRLGSPASVREATRRRSGSRFLLT